MSGGIIQDEEWLEAFERSLSGHAFHLLRFIHYDDWPVGCQYVDRFAAAEVVPFGIDDAALLVGSAFLQ